MALATSKKFSEDYGPLRERRVDRSREAPNDVSEEVFQCIWYDHLFRADGLQTTDGKSLRIVSPGWWNRGEGPDFKGAQIEFDGKLKTGEVEIDLRHSAWREHGHDINEGFNDVILHVTLESKQPSRAIVTAGGRSVPSLLLAHYLEEDVEQLRERIEVDHYPFGAQSTLGHCAALVEAYGSGRISELLNLAGEWRMLFKARLLRERMDRVGADQALYEAFMSACGFSHFKHHLRAIAQQLHYDRARQLAREDALLLEAAFLSIGGLLPQSLPQGTTAVPHFARLRALKRDRLGGMRPLPLVWKRVGVRPNNNPERRLAGAALFIARTSDPGLDHRLNEIWMSDMGILERRRRFEEMFPGAKGFWASHCTWGGKRMAKPSAPLGPGRIRSIIGNVFVPAGLAAARQRRDRLLEERVLEFFAGLPQEPDNKVQKIMLPRIFGAGTPPRITFRTQQGLLQMHQDWCEANPSCRNCRVIQYLDPGQAG